MKYNQFCPVAKAAEILGGRWTFLIIRELLMGASHFNELQRGLGLISPTMLTKRLSELNANGLVTRKRITGQKGYEYHLTEAGKELFPVIKQLGDWGMRWARGQMADSELDIELLMLYLKRSIQTDKLPGEQTIIQFQFGDMSKIKKWWIVVNGSDVDVCIDDPGKEVDIWFITELPTMIEIWMGDRSYKSAIREKKLKVVGPTQLVGNITRWMSNSIFAGIPSAREI